MVLKELLSRSDPKKVCVVCGHGTQKLACTAESGRDEEHAEAGGGEMFFKSAGLGVVAVGGKFVMDGPSALGTTVKFEEKTDGNRFFAKLAVTVGTDRKPILIEGLPD